MNPLGYLAGIHVGYRQLTDSVTHSDSGPEPARVPSRLTCARSRPVPARPDLALPTPNPTKHTRRNLQKAERQKATSRSAVKANDARAISRALETS